MKLVSVNNKDKCLSVTEQLTFDFCGLIFLQALICSSFVPIYCGLIPPSFRGVVSLLLRSKNILKILRMHVGVFC